MSTGRALSPPPLNQSLKKWYNAMLCVHSLIYSELLTYLGRSVQTTTYSHANFQGVKMQLGWKHSNTLGVQENANLYS